MTLSNLEKKLPVKIKKVWQLSAVITVIILIAISVILYAISMVTSFSILFSIFMVVMAILYVPFAFMFEIPFRFKRWRYQIRTDEIEIQRGIFFRKRVLIPMIRIQHVETTQGPLLRQQSLVALSITTAADTHQIEAVEVSESNELRRHILELIKVAKEDV